MLGSMLSVLYLAIRAEEDSAGCGKSGMLRKVIRQNIKCGGDSCARGILLGALYGAAQVHTPGSVTVIPEPWLSSMRPEVLKEISEVCVKLVALNQNNRSLLDG
jgi:hypothetical protein